MMIRYVLPYRKVKRREVNDVDSVWYKREPRILDASSPHEGGVPPFAELPLGEIG
jgi:hypothetical protein